jgi:branched-chain amino acid aminotransferase
MTNELQVYIDGEFYPKSQAKISVYDQDFSTATASSKASANTAIVFNKEHIDRLYRSARYVQIP